MLRLNSSRDKGEADEQNTTTSVNCKAPDSLFCGNLINHKTAHYVISIYAV